MALELDPKYNPRGVETKWYEAYESHNAFQPEFGESAGVTDHNAKPFSIVIPPPNVTGSLHVGHADRVWQHPRNLQPVVAGAQE